MEFSAACIIKSVKDERACSVFDVERRREVFSVGVRNRAQSALCRIQRGGCFVRWGCSSSDVMILIIYNGHWGEGCNELFSGSGTDCLCYVT